MESVYLGIKVVSPLVIYMTIGIIVRRIGLVSKKSFDEMNKVVFRVFLAALVFINSYQAELDALLSTDSIKVITIALSAVLIMVCIAIFAGQRVIHDEERRVVIIQGIYRSNLVLFGLPISISIYGEGHQGVISILIAIVVPLFNIIAACLLNGVNNKDKSRLMLILGAFKNPLVFCSLLGLAFNAMGIRLPELVTIPIDKIASAATPVAFVLLGGSLAFKNIRKDIKPILTVSTLRLIIVPLIVIITAAAVGLRGPSLVALFAAFASPIAVSSYTMSKDLEVAPELAGELVAVTTTLSAFTVFIWVSILNSLNLL